MRNMLPSLRSWKEMPAEGVVGQLTTEKDIALKHFGCTFDMLLPCPINESLIFNAISWSWGYWLQESKDIKPSIFCLYYKRRHIIPLIQDYML